jgi:hypothetical protein
MNAVRPVARNLKIAVKIAKTGGVLCLSMFENGVIIG